MRIRQSDFTVVLLRHRPRHIITRMSQRRRRRDRHDRRRDRPHLRGPLLELSIVRNLFAHQGVQHDIGRAGSGTVRTVLTRDEKIVGDERRHVRFAGPSTLREVEMDPRVSPCIQIPNQRRVRVRATECPDNGVVVVDEATGVASSSEVELHHINREELLIAACRFIDVQVELANRCRGSVDHYRDHRNIAQQQGVGPVLNLVELQWPEIGVVPGARPFAFGPFGLIRDSHVIGPGFSITAVDDCELETVNGHRAGEVEHLGHHLDACILVDQLRRAETRRFERRLIHDPGDRTTVPFGRLPFTFG